MVDKQDVTIGGLPKLFTSKDPKLWHYRAYVIRVVDGDTVHLVIDRGMHDYSLEKVRLAGIDAPELRPRVGSPSQRTHERALAEASTQRLRELILHKEVVIRTAKAGKFGRWLAQIYLPDDNKTTANQVLLDEGHAVEYGTKRPWRDE